MKLGKLQKKDDAKTIQLGDILKIEYPVPSVYDFDKGRRPFPDDAWGNHDYGDCVMAGRTNQLLRLERIETRRTPPITAEEVVKRYFELTGGEDSGLVVLDALKDWRNVGWDIPTHSGTRHYTISAYGELNPHNSKQLRMGCYLLHGVQLGFAMPLSAVTQTRNGQPWDVVDGPDGEPGSWGGHLVASFRYDFENFYVKSWGKTIQVTNSFIQKYCDEAWAVVDDLDTWRNDALDLSKLREILKDIGASKIG